METAKHKVHVYTRCYSTNWRAHWQGNTYSSTVLVPALLISGESVFEEVNLRTFMYPLYIGLGNKGKMMTSSNISTVSPVPQKE